MALGFGISSPEQVADACAVADAAVVGSALVNVVAEHGAAADVLRARERVRAVAEEQLVNALDDLRKPHRRARRGARPAAERARRVRARDRPVKKQIGLAIYQPSREAEVLGHVQAVNPGPLDDGAVRRLFERIIDEARRLERIADGTSRRADRGAVGGQQASVAPVNRRRHRHHETIEALWL